MNENNLEFHEIWNTIQPKIQRYLVRMVGKREADDLMQEVFLKVHQALDKFKGKSHISTWIYRIATNAALDRFRSSSFQKDKQNIAISELARELTEKKFLGEAKIPLADQQCIRKEMNICIRGYVEKLPKNYRTVLVLSELEGMKNKEIANILKVSIDTVKIRLHRARLKLRKALEDNCYFYHDDNNELACDLKIRRSPKNSQE